MNTKNIYLVSLVEKMYAKNILEGFMIDIFTYDKQNMNCIYTRRYITKIYMYKLINNQQIIPINFTIKANRLTQIKFKDNKELINNTTKIVRNYMERIYGTGTSLAGRCIEASEYIATILRYFGIKDAKTVEGWCIYDDEDYGSSIPYDAHTWVELNNGKVYIDVTADQFNSGMEQENSFAPIIIKNGLPHGIRYDKPEEGVDYWL